MRGGARENTSFLRHPRAKRGREPTKRFPLQRPYLSKRALRPISTERLYDQIERDVQKESFMRFRISHGLALITLAFVVTGCKTTGHKTSTPTWPQAQAREIQAAAARLGVPVETENMINYSRGGTVFSTATARSWRSTPATELSRGVTFAVAYLDSPGQNIPAAYYSLRAFADPNGPGTYEGRIEVINASGTVVRQVPATIGVQSMTVPSGADRISPRIAVGTIPPAPEPLKCVDDATGRTCWCCTNGHLICTNGLVGPATTLTRDIN